MFPFILGCFLLVFAHFLAERTGFEPAEAVHLARFPRAIYGFFVKNDCFTQKKQPILLNFSLFLRVTFSVKFTLEQFYLFDFIFVSDVLIAVFVF